MKEETEINYEQGEGRGECIHYLHLGRVENSNFNMENYHFNIELQLQPSTNPPHLPRAVLKWIAG
jgi:hypothetical protein